MEKIKLDEVKASSRRSPFLGFQQERKLHRQALVLEGLAHGFDGETLFSGGDLILEAGARLAVIGENGSGKTTFLRCLMGQISADQGLVKWSENAALAYCPQDSTADFDTSLNLFDWMSQWRKPGHDDLQIRGTLGRLLFSADDYKKQARVCSGGEKNRLLFGRMMLSGANVLVLDEPTNHLDMESIEALNQALAKYEGTVIFVSHDRKFVSSLATRIIEIKDRALVSFQGSYDEYLASQMDISRVA